MILEQDLKSPTLGDVKKVVRSECFTPSWNWALSYLAIGLTFYGFTFAFSIYALQMNLYYLYPIAWFLMGTSVTSLFVLGHDCAHESFTNSKRFNSFIGHMLFMPSFYPYYAWKYSHHAHHHNTNKLGAPANSVYYDNAWIPMTTKQYELIHKRYPVKAFLYRLSRSFLPIGSTMHNLLYHYFPSKFTKDHRKNVYFSYIVLATLVAISFVYTIYLTDNIFSIFHFWILPAFFFQFWMSLYTFLHHSSEETEFYEEAEWDQYKGQILSTLNYTMPKWISLLHFHIDIHTPHHLNIKIPCYRLPDALRDLKNSKFSEDIFIKEFQLRDYFQTIQTCKLWDLEKRKYVGFPS
ncbi:MAG: fatty acid desaturase [Leptospiraceae bacterium]|nr:fatty acid desaturase [Leptospiraceae bacterium]